MIDHSTFINSGLVQTSDKKICNDVTLMWYFIYLKFVMLLIRTMHNVGQRFIVNLELVIQVYKIKNHIVSHI